MLDHELSTTDASLIAASLTDGSAFAAVFDRHGAGSIAGASRAPAPRGRTSPPRPSASPSDERARFDPRYADARPWLYGIATNLVRRHFR